MPFNVSTQWPSTFLNFFSGQMQPLTEVVPTDLVTEPRISSVQNSHFSFATCLLVNFPASQLSQEEAPMPLIFPDPHCRHSLLSGEE